jgi:hypothetical protein
MEFGWKELGMRAIVGTSAMKRPKRLSAAQESEPHFLHMRDNPSIQESNHKSPDRFVPVRKQNRETLFF